MKHILIITDVTKGEWEHWRNAMDFGGDLHEICKVLGIIPESRSGSYLIPDSCPGESMLYTWPEQRDDLRYPKDQAEWMTKVLGDKWPDMVIVTNSDYILDRAVIEYRERGKGNFELFLCASGETKTPHVMEFDRNGNLTSVPKGYRRWHGDEQNRYLGCEKLYPEKKGGRNAK